MRTLLLLSLLFASAALALDVSGRWRGEAVIDGRSTPVHLTLVQQGATLKGTGGPTEVDQQLLSNPAIRGNRLSFDVGPPGRTPAHFEVSATEWELKGTVRASRNGQRVTGQVLLRKRTN